MTFPQKGNIFRTLSNLYASNEIAFLASLLISISVLYFIHFLLNGLGLAYNDARSHLDIGRRVVEGLKPGISQLGSVWLPLPHFLMIATIWNDFMWHSGLAGALQSMISFVATGVMIILFLKEIGVGKLGRIIGLCVFVANMNILYLQSTAMTELLLIATMMAASYQLLVWFKYDGLFNLVQAAFWVMLSTLVRYDGWFLCAYALVIIGLYTWRKKGLQQAEGTSVLFGTLAGFGIVLWFLWNLLIFKDPLYFMFGQYSAHSQQQQLEQAGVLATKSNWLLSLKVYVYALAYNSNTFVTIVGIIGASVLWVKKRKESHVILASLLLFAPLLFNILALYLGHSVLYIQGISGDTWFNVRYGVMMMPSIAIFIGYLVDAVKSLRFTIIGLLMFVIVFSFLSNDAVTIDDATVGSSQKNVSEVSGWLQNNAQKSGFVLISAASHDAIIFSSGLPMSKYIHEGTGKYWTSATLHPEKWARWIVMRTNDVNDQTFKLVSQTTAYKKDMYTLVDHYPFADIYELKPEYVHKLIIDQIYPHQK